MLDRWRQLKREVNTLFYASRDPRLSWLIKLWVILVVAYAFSPIDLVPDFIPVLGYLDDLVIVPAGIYLALKWIPDDIYAEARVRADNQPVSRLGWIGAAIVVLLWVTGLLLVVNILS